MYETTLKPDFNKLRKYFTVTEEDITRIGLSDGVPIHLDYMSEASFLRVSDALRTATVEHGIEDHFTELLCLILTKNEQIRERYDAYMQNYNDDQTSSEVAKFLLAYKESESNHEFHLVAKPLTGSVAIKDTAVAKWMCEQVFKAIEKRDFPLDVFGEKILYDLFGDEFKSDKPISMERLKATAMLRPRKPTVRVRKLYVEFCKYLQVYLINETRLTASEDVLLTDAQANFFFTILESIGYIDGEKIDSEPKDYIHTLFRNVLN